MEERGPTTNGTNPNKKQTLSGTPLPQAFFVSVELRFCFIHYYYYCYSLRQHLFANKKVVAWDTCVCWAPHPPDAACFFLFSGKVIIIINIAQMRFVCENYVCFKTNQISDRTNLEPSLPIWRLMPHGNKEKQKQLAGASVYTNFRCLGKPTLSISPPLAPAIEFGVSELIRKLWSLIFRPK